HRRGDRPRQLQGERVRPDLRLEVISWQFCVKKDSPLRTFKDVYDECKKRRVVIGTIGRAGSSHIQLAALQKELNMPAGIVHFDGSGKAYPAVLRGPVQVAIAVSRA